MIVDYFVWYTCMNFTIKAPAAAALGLHQGRIIFILCAVMLWLHYGYCTVVMAVAMAAASARGEAVLWLL